MENESEIKRVQVHFYMPIGLAKRMQAQAKSENRSIANWIKTAIEKILK